MPGEQLACVLHAVSTVDGKKDATSDIPKLILQGVMHSLQQLKVVNFSNDTFQQNFLENKKISFEDIKFFICNFMRANDASVKELCDEIEAACWNICKETFSAPLDCASLEKFWRVAMRLTDENSYPPKIAKEECKWFMTKLTTMLGADWMSKEFSIPDSDLSFQEFVDTSCHNYFCKLSQERVNGIIEDLHCWLVDEVLKAGWLYKRTRKQANWTSWAKRWCILTPRKMEYFKKGKLIDEIEIRRHTKIEALSAYQGIIQAHKYRFKASNYPVAECELAADTDAEKTLWISCLEDAINSAKENTTPVQKLLKRRRHDGIQSNQAEEELDRMFKKTVRLRKCTPSLRDEGEIGEEKKSGNHRSKHRASPVHKCEEKESSDVFLEQEKQKLKTIFLKIDKDGNGVLSRTEFSDFVKNMGLEMTESEIDLVFNTCDTDKSGHVTFDEFQQYFAQHILGETGTGKCVAALRRAFLKADRDGSGTLTFREFTEYIWDRKRSVRISSLLDVFGKMGKSDTEEVSFNDFQEFLLKEQTSLPVIEEEEGRDELTFENHLKCAFDETEAKELANYVRDRWNAFATFRRKGARGKTVMKGGHGMVADFVPGEYTLVDLACFSDLPPLVPKHTVIKGITWQSSSEKGKSGKVIFPKDFDGKIQTDIATNELLRYYDCSFADSQQEKISLLFRHGIQDFTYENEYLSDYVKATNGGAGIERHEFSHLDCPLDEQSGNFILAKIVDDDELHVTGFKVPVRHTLYIPGGTIHSNDYLKGTWRTMLSDEVDIDHVHLIRQDEKGNLEHFTFDFI